MALLDFAHREITAKVVYFGAASAGSSTNVRTLHQILSVKAKSEVHRFAPEGESEQTWFFEYVPAGGRTIKDFTLRWQVYAVPGGLTHPAHRREILRGTDAVVFVADARPGRDQHNIDSLLDLERLLHDEHLEMAAMPMVIQVNHTDAEGARDPEEVVFDLNPYGFPVIEAVASDSTGVLEAHEQVNSVTAQRIRDNLAGKETAITLTAVHRPERESDGDVVARHLEALEAAEREQAKRVRTEEPWADLQRAGEIEIPYQPADFEGTRPLHVLEAGVEGASVVVELVMETDSGNPRRLRVTLVDAPATGLSVGSTPVEPTPTPTDTSASSPLDALPDHIDLPTPSQRNDLPPLYYGIAGLSGGLVIGVLLAVILFL